ncbi:pre-rRNA-processing protein pno1 [Entomophthora muscae]|uniref:Pre-rRNA-processing protein pno1 n=1 Tax=Entomophthora muscae TaxID=34485 RepID=A0ACC2S1T8_9FUNG|nr:pre-rRNA-processing protein pno1 [Entomophthora muscae]
MNYILIVLKLKMSKLFKETICLEPSVALLEKIGKTKFAIENTTKTRLVIADTKIHILGSFQNIRIAKDAVCSLILGSPPGKVYANLRNISARLKERF